MTLTKNPPALTDVHGDEVDGAAVVAAIDEAGYGAVAA